MQNEETRATGYHEVDWIFARWLMDVCMMVDWMFARVHVEKRGHHVTYTYGIRNVCTVRYILLQYWCMHEALLQAAVQRHKHAHPTFIEKCRITRTPTTQKLSASLTRILRQGYGHIREDYLSMSDT